MCSAGESGERNWKRGANRDESSTASDTTRPAISRGWSNNASSYFCHPRFFGRKPVLMVVEPESLCWLTGRRVKARDGATWAEEFARFPALRAVVRDDGSGLGKGIKIERARRQAAGLPDLDDSLDLLHTLREGGRALRKTWGA